jgi:Tol biopolymer transport system component
MRRFQPLWISVALMLCSCQSFGDLLIFGPSLVRPGALPSDQGAMPATVPLASPRPVMRVQAEFYLDGEARLNGAPLGGAVVTVVDLSSGKILASGAQADGDGRFRVTFGEPVTPGTVLLVKAATGKAVLSSLVRAGTAAGGEAGTPTGGGPYRIGHAGIGLGSTLVTKEVLPKLLEVLVTGSGTPGGDERLAGLMVRVGGLEKDAGQILAEIPTDARFWRAIQEANAHPDSDTIDALAVNAVQYSSLRGGFGGFVEAANETVVTNLQEGGPFLSPAPWQVGYFVVEPPEARRSGYDTALLVYRGRRITLPVRPAAFEDGATRWAGLGTIRQDLHNAPPPPPLSGGGGGAAVPVVPLPPPPPALTGLLTFTSDQLHGTGDVFSIQLDGTGLTTLTNDTYSDFFPVYSPDGTKIAFIADSAVGVQLSLMNADGTGRQLLTHATFSGFPSWSPDGTKIAFVTPMAGDDDIAVYDLTTSTVTQLTTDFQLDMDPRWSPNGQWIAFTSFRSGGGDIYVIKPDGTGETRLTTDPIYDSNPAWSPDSQWIAFQAKRDDEIYKIKPDGTGETRITHAAGASQCPFWSPNGQWISFHDDRSGTYDIYIITPDGTDETAVATSPGTDQWPVWTSDSQTLVFRSNRAGQFDLYRTQLDGSNQVPILSRPADENWPNVH